MDLFNLLRSSRASLASRAKNALNWYANKLKNLGKTPPSAPIPPPSGIQPPSIPPITPPITPTADQIVSDIEKQTTAETSRGYFRRSTDVPRIGKMYFYTYDPKYKDILPFYDMFPLVIPIHHYKDGFLGLNLHYLPPNQRAALLMSLFNLLNNNKFDDTTAFNVTYGLLKNATVTYAGYQNCIKRYLYGHIRSPIQEIYATEWENVVLLPWQRWVVNTNKKYSRTPPY